MNWIAQVIVDIAVLVDNAGNVDVHRLMSGFLPLPEAILHQDAHSLRLCVERLVSVEHGPSLNLPAVSTRESKGGGPGPHSGGGPPAWEWGWHVPNRLAKRGSVLGRVIRSPMPPNGA